MKIRRRAIILAAAAAVAAFVSPAARAADINVDQANGNSPFTFTGTTTYDTVRVAVSSTGTLTQNSGTLTANTALIVAANTNSVGTYNFGSIGVLNVVGPATVGLAGNGTFNQTAGTATLNGGLTLSGATNGRGTYNLNGGTLVTSLVRGNINGGTNANFYFNGGTLRPTASSTTFFQGLTATYIRNGAATIDTNGQSITVAQGLLHSTTSGDNAKDGGVTKVGTGTLTLAGTSNYTGDTNVYNGTLSITGSIGFPYQFGFTPQTYFRVNGTTTPVAGLSGSGSIRSYSSDIGSNDKGIFNQSGGTNTIETLLSVGRSDLFDNSASNGAYNLSGGTLNSASANIGDGGNGSFTHTGGTFTTGPLRVGYAPNNQNIGNGTYTLGGTGALSTGATLVGDAAPGTFTQTAGTHNSGSLSVGRSGGTASYALSGTGQLTITYQSLIGDGGTGAFAHSAGTFKGGQVTVGSGGSNSTYALSGTGQLQIIGAPTVGSQPATAADLYVKSGKFTQTGGTNSVTGKLDLGTGVAANAAVDCGTYALSAGTVTSAQTVVGDAGRGTFTQTGGTHTTGGLSVALASSTGSYSLGGTGTLTVNGNALVGAAGTGTFAQSAGTNNVSGILYLGFPGQSNAATSGNGTYTLSGGSLTTNATQIANQGTGTFTHTGGTHTTTQTFVGLNNAAGVYTLSGNGVLSNSNVAFVGFTGPGTFNQNGGAATIGALYLSAGANGSGTYNLNGGTLFTGGVVGNTGGGANAVMNLNGGTLRAGAASPNFLQNLSLVNVRNGGAVIDTNGLAVSIVQPLLHSTIGGDAAIDGGLVKNGAGTLTLTANNNYTGNTTVAAGTLAITAGTIGVLNTTAQFTVDGTAAANATASLSGNGYLANSAAYVGRVATGMFNQSGGTHATANLYVGATSGGSIYGLSGGQLAVGTNAFIGYGGTGTFTHSGGAANVTGVLFLGFAGTAVTTGKGTYTFSNGTLATAETQVGNTGTGIFNQTGGTLTTPRLFLGLTGGTGAYNLSGTGVLNTTGFTGVGLGGPGTFTQAGGTATFSNGLILSAGANGQGTYNLNGGTINARAVTGNINTGTNATLNFNGGTLRPTLVNSAFIAGLTAANVRNGGARIDTNGINVTVNQVLRHSTISGDTAVDGGLTKLGAGTLTLNGANTYTGTTTVAAGTLVLAPAAYTPVLANAGGVNVTGGRLVLNYASTTTPAVQVKSILDAGYAGNFAAGQIRSTALPAGLTLGYADRDAVVLIAVTLPGDADLDGDVDFNDFLNLQTNFGQAGTRFDQGNFNYDAATDFNDFLALQTNFGQSISGAAVAVTGGQDVAMTAFAQTNAVPEPTALAVIGVGVTCALRRHRVWG